jgi:hypothetical protein
MVELLDLGERVLALRIDGRIEKTDIERIFAELDRTLAGEGKIRVYMEIAALTGVALDALWRDLQLALQRLNAIPRIERAAVATDAGWIRTAAGVEDRVFRGIDVRAFELARVAEARAWVAEGAAGGAV